MTRRTLLVLIAAVSGCADIFGLGDYVEGEGGADVTDAGPLPDVIPDLVVVGDGGPCSSPNMCVPVLPSGWTFVAYDQAFRPACSTGFTTPTDVQEGLTAPPATCGCTCTPSAPSCPTLAVTAGNNMTCSNGATENVTLSDGGCTTLGTSIMTSSESMSAFAAPEGGCIPDASVSVVPATTSYQGRICELGVEPGGGCDAGVCVPVPSPYAICVYQAGVVACPAGFPTQHVVGSSIADDRGCSPCTCTPDGGSCGGTATFYVNANCNATSQVVAADGGCVPVTNQTFKSVAYVKGTTDPSCAPSIPSPTGDAGFASPVTVCCTP